MGVLVINLAKNDQYKYYTNLNYLSIDDFRIPYFPPLNEITNYDKEMHAKLCYETSRLLVGALGLKNVF